MIFLYPKDIELWELRRKLDFERNMRRRAKRRRRRWELTWIHFVNRHIVKYCFIVIKRAKRRRRR